MIWSRPVALLRKALMRKSPAPGEAAVGGAGASETADRPARAAFRADTRFDLGMRVTSERVGLQGDAILLNRTASFEAARGMLLPPPPGVSSGETFGLSWEGPVSQIVAVVDALKRALKAKKLTYAHVANELAMSEASVKRMFASGRFTLGRFEQVCQFAGLGLTELAREVDSEKNYIVHMTLEQEREVVGNPKLFLVAVCALNHLTLEQIVATYDISRTECIQLLLKLDRIKFLELMPHNRIRLKVSPDFSWLPNGPILQYFMTRAHQEYFRSRFDGPGETIMVMNAMLSQASSAQVAAKLRKVLKEFTELHNDDKHLAIGERRPASVVLALRPWELDDFNRLRRRRKSKTA